jgi:hypothetical protein
MKKTVTDTQAINELLKDEYAGWSHEGATALVAYLEEEEELRGEKFEFDVVAIRCDFTEYRNAWEAMESITGGEDMPMVEDTGTDENGHGMDLVETAEESEKLALEWLQEKTLVIKFKGGIIIQNL